MTRLLSRLALLGFLLPAMLGGSVIIESIFTIPGMGLLGFEAILSRDYPVVMAISTISAFLTLLGLLLLPLLCALGLRAETIDEMFDLAKFYDKADRNGPKIFVGEWATREGSPTPNLGSALGDAAFLTGLERNSDIVIMASYAPLFVNVNPGGMQWTSDLIGYDALTSYGSPAYYAQVMFSSCLGDHTVESSLSGAGDRVFYSATAKPAKLDDPEAFLQEDEAHAQAEAKSRPPVVTVMGLQVGALLGGAVLTETLFSWPGIGKWMIDAIARRDYPVVQAGIVISALVFMGVNLCVEVLYGLINPRMRAPSPVRANE